jgi:hypothetical protein
VVHRQRACRLGVLDRDREWVDARGQQEPGEVFGRAELSGRTLDRDFPDDGRAE